jgi:NADH-quinone oxidoreductase subunit J
MTLPIITFLVLALVAVAAAVGMLLSRNAVYAALFLVLNFVSVAILYLTLGAPFIAMAQVTVYAGAIMVLFLFVIMLLGAEKLSTKETVVWQRPLAILLGVILLIESGYALFVRSPSAEMINVPPSDFASPAAIGEVLFNQYMLPFEVTSILLLIAVVGVIVLTKPGDRVGRK